MGLAVSRDGDGDVNVTCGGSGLLRYIRRIKDGAAIVSPISGALSERAPCTSAEGRMQMCTAGEIGQIIRFYGHGA